MMERMKIKVDVTQDDIDKGERSECCKCPVARALLRTVPGAVRVSVGDPVIEVEVLGTVEDGNMILEGSLPYSAVQFIEAFDGNKSVEPFSFETTLSEDLVEYYDSEDDAYWGDVVSERGDEDVF